ncbi:17301_t:CDS:2, partial [Funneliformis geosporum]
MLDIEESIKWLENSENYLNYYEYSDFRNLKLIGDGAFGSVMKVVKEHAKNILVHQKSIKIADFGLSKKIFDDLNNTNEIRGCIPYIDPKITAIIQGKRETIIDGTPIEYGKIYQDCWKYEPDKRPNMHEVVSSIKAITSLLKSLRITSIKSENNLSLHRQKSSHSSVLVVRHASSNANFHANNLSKDSFEAIFINKESINKLIKYIIKKQDEGITFEQIKNLIEHKILDFNQTINKLVEWLKENKQNNQEFAWLLGLFYYHNIGINENGTKAFELFLKSAENNYSISQVYLAKCFYNGYGIECYKKLSFNWYHKAVENGSIIGQLYLGHCYEFGIGTQANKMKSVYWYREATNNRNLTAKLQLANCYRIGKGIKKDEYKAFEYYEILAKQEIADAQYQLGNCFYNGIGTKSDKVQASCWYEKAAHYGHIIATDDLKKKFDKKLKLKKNEDAKLYKKIYIKGLNKIGTFNHSGLGKKRKEKALNNFRKATEGGNKVAQYHLGHYYQYSERINEIKAFEFYKMSADQGYNFAQVQLGYCYDNYDKGFGIEFNKEKAFDLYLKVAEEENLIAIITQNNLGKLYENGEGVEQDLDKAIYWYNKSAETSLYETTEIKANFLFQGVAEIRIAIPTFNGLAKIISISENNTIKKANYWYDRAVGNRTDENGHGIGQYKLGECYDLGNGVEKNEIKAFENYQKSANQGYLNAKFQLGYCFINGIGIDTSREKGIKLYNETAKRNDDYFYKESANKGYLEAKYKVGYFYEYGIVVDIDKEKALELFKVAAEEGNSNSQKRITNLYEYEAKQNKNL